MREVKYRDNHGIDYVRDLTIHRETQTEHDPYEELAIATYLQAVRDFRMGFRRNLYGFPEDTQIQKDFDESVRFLYSNKFDDLIDIDGEYIMMEIESEEREKKKKMTEKQKANMKEQLEKAWKEWRIRQKYVKQRKKTEPNAQKQTA